MKHLKNQIATATIRKIVQSSLLWLGLITVLFNWMACSEGLKTSENPTPTEMVKNLSSIEMKKAFLEEIWHIDQQVRKNESQVLQKHGYDSEAYKQAKSEMVATDKNNLSKIEAYFKEHGHPDIDEVGELAAQTPFIVIHHCAGLDCKTRNFPYIYNAWKNEDIENDEFIFYLGRFYDTKFGERLKMKNPYTEEQQIQALIKGLELEPLTK